METIEKKNGLIRRGSGKVLGIAAAALLAGFSQVEANAQQLYDDGETVTGVTYVTRPEGRVQQFTDNPAPDSVNKSGKCARFARTRQRYDYIKVVPESRLQDVAGYASYDEAAPRLRMKLYTNAPVGSVVELQLGKRDANAYPEGTHSQYQAVTTKTGQWEDLEFKFITTPKGSETSARQVDQVTLLFMPNTTSNFVFYFDDIRGPQVQDERSAKATKRKRGH